MENYEFKIERLNQNIYQRIQFKKKYQWLWVIKKIFTAAENQTFPKDEDRTWQPTFDRTITEICKKFQ
jgi:hypothetical protein